MKFRLQLVPDRPAERASARLPTLGKNVSRLARPARVFMPRTLAHGEDDRASVGTQVGEVSQVIQVQILSAKMDS